MITNYLSQLFTIDRNIVNQAKSSLYRYTSIYRRSSSNRAAIPRFLPTVGVRDRFLSSKPRHRRLNGQHRRPLSVTSRRAFLYPLYYTPRDSFSRLLTLARSSGCVTGRRNSHDRFPFCSVYLCSRIHTQTADTVPDPSWPALPAARSAATAARSSGS